MRTFIRRTLQSFGYTVIRNSTFDNLVDSSRALDNYRGRAAGYFGQVVERDLRNVKLHSIYPPDGEWFRRAHGALLGVEHDYIQVLINDLAQKGVKGDFAEFGIFEGAWVNLLYEMTERAGLGDRRVFGFDSFQGLSKPHTQFDTSYWKEGMYAAGRQQVEHNVKAHERPRVQLVEGFFNTSLNTPEAAALGEVAFARIDCDIYEPAKECLEFLSKRLVHGSILVFDDWAHNFDVGEDRAFAEWVPTVPHLQFRFLFLGPWDHLHIRVLHRDKEDIFAS